MAVQYRCVDETMPCLIADAVLVLLSLTARCASAKTWCYYCNWTRPDDVFKCEDISAQCIRCNDPLVACIGESCFRYVAANGSYIVGCLEKQERTRCENTNASGVERKCYCSKTLCNSADSDSAVITLMMRLLLLTVCIHLLQVPLHSIWTCSS